MTTSNKTKIIGIGGLSRSGKDSLAEFFIKNGFYGVSFGDIIRRYARKRHHDKPDPISVANMTETANWLRDEKGADVVLKQALQEFEDQQKAGGKYKGLILFSVRAPVEADFILSKGGELIWVEASDETRYRRMVDNLREGEVKISLGEFIRQENLQAEPQPDVPVEAQMNAPYVESKATVVFENNVDNLEQFNQRARQLVERLSH